MKEEQKKAVKEAMGHLNNAREVVQNLIDKFQSEYDDMSERQQEGEKGEKLSEVIGQLEDMDNELDNNISSLNDMSQS